MVCFFEGPNLPSSINGAIPTFGVNPSNTNFLAATGSFTNKKDEICTFPKSYTGNKDGENTITPYIMGDFVTRGATARATLPCKGLNGAKTYTSFQCPQVTYNRMAQGTFTMFFVAPTGPEFKPYVFAVSSPTTTTDYHGDDRNYLNGVGVCWKLSIEHLFYHTYVRFIYFHFYVRILHSFRINRFHSDHYFHQYEYGVFHVDHFLNNFGYSNPSDMPWL
ncbi:hypothetical protein GTA08_BOTSDO10064 [Neofusicoccum parvum]|nr:hypothetical protein GTA08_BOTSDO10064 [Neofusicoccum parvum]